MKKAGLIICLFVTFLYGSVFASENESSFDFFAKAGGGYIIPIDNNDETNFGLTEWEFDDGYSGSLSLGFEIGHFALEAEGAYRKMDGENRIVKATRAQSPITGDQTHLSGMINAYFIVSPDSDIRPYFGVGAGMTEVSWNDVDLSPASGTIIDDSETVFSYQLIAGVSFLMTKNLFLEFDYRYFNPDDVSLKDSAGTESKMEDLHLHIIQVGLKLKF